MIKIINNLIKFFTILSIEVVKLMFTIPLAIFRGVRKWTKKNLRSLILKVKYLF